MTEIKTFFDEYGGEKKSMKRLIALMFAATVNFIGVALAVAFLWHGWGADTLLIFAGEGILAVLTILGFNTAKYKFYKDASNGNHKPPQN